MVVACCSRSKKEPQGKSQSGFHVGIQTAGGLAPTSKLPGLRSTSTGPQSSRVAILVLAVLL
eukprot:12916195-Prorocentrum_lima.AAC.1